ncbi:inositol monophosphatase family protein [Buchnera aphidicola (Ceratoglyphina bambusae)]|uniref:inositol monophosphatase family protein n=1 Tax=Buchnera aphidicola TaxID=9 RepID=UPI0031B83DEB
MNPMLNIAISSIRKAGSFIIKFYDSNIFFNKKFNENFLYVNQIVKRSENIIINEIKKYYPNHIYITKDNSDFNFNKKKIYWFINSLDGVLNFKNKFPHFCLLISNFINKKIFMSVIYDPIKNELFTSIKGEGSKINGYRMRCDYKFLNNDIIIAFNIYKKFNKNKKFYKNIINKLISKNVYIRITGSVILDFAYVSSGRLNCLLIEKNNILNFFSGELQIKESGGLTYNLFKNLNNNISKNSILITGNDNYIKKIISIINKK